jgi:hypothetical protein
MKIFIFIFICFVFYFIQSKQGKIEQYLHNILCAGILPLSPLPALAPLGGASQGGGGASQGGGGASQGERARATHSMKTKLNLSLAKSKISLGLFDIDSNLINSFFNQVEISKYLNIRPSPLLPKAGEGAYCWKTFKIR